MTPSCYVSVVCLWHMIQGTRWLSYLCQFLARTPRTAVERDGTAEEDIWASERGSGSKIGDRYASETNRFLMINLDRIRIQCAGNLPKNQPAQMCRIVLGASATYASNRFRLFFQRRFFSYYTIFANCIIFRITSNVTLNNVHLK